MKKQIMIALLGITILAAMAVTASAQAGRRLTVHVPFDFVVGGRQLPAGDYSVRRITKESETALMIQSADGRSAATVMTNASGEEPSRAELTFRQHGDEYFLASVSMPGTVSVREVPRSKAEQRRTRELIEQAEAGRGPEEPAAVVTVAGTVQ